MASSENTEVIEETTPVLETGEETEEITETETETETETPEEETTQTVSSGDSVVESTLSNDILYQLELHTVALEQITETMEEQKLTIWEKPIEDYTPTEGILLIIMFLILGIVIFKFIGGIICLK